jgi:hypothetical protein
MLTKGLTGRLRSFESGKLRGIQGANGWFKGLQKAEFVGLKGCEKLRIATI